MFQLHTNQKSTKHSENNQKNQSNAKRPLPLTLNSFEDVRIQYKKEPSSNLQIKQPSEQIIQLITPLSQTGANCGMFAMAMALHDLIGADGNQIAIDLEKYAITNNYSAIGEAFNADELAALGQTFCDQNYPHAELLVKVVPFQTRKQMKTILQQSIPNQLYVLLPYYAGGDNIDPTSLGGAQATSKQMLNAHWSVTEKKNPGDDYRILEGWQGIFGGPDNSTLTRDRYRILFESNQSLGDQVKWNSYIEKCDITEFTNFQNSGRLNNQIQTGPSGEITEAANLRGKAVLIGTRNAVEAALTNLHQ